VTEEQPPQTQLLEIRGANRLVFERFALTTLGASSQRQVFAQETVHVGSARRNDFFIDDRTVSRFHLRIEHQAARHAFLIVDLNSTNGTYLGEHRVKEAFLQGPAVIRIGQTQIRFEPLGDTETVDLPDIDHLGPLIGASPHMRRLYMLAQRIAPTDAPVIIEGETGTGKDLFAQVIHRLSRRSDGPFEVIDCTAIPPSLVESELFGHVRGAFTGAVSDRPGVFERASGGTVFIDELGELRLDIQPKLLRVLEGGEVRRVGGDHLQRVDVRIIAATNRCLQDMVNQNTFREDLYYRLAVCKIEIPALRQRREDIPLLAAHFLEALRTAGHRDLPDAIDALTMESLVRQAWPGNIRELRNAVERIAIIGDTSMDARTGSSRHMGAAARQRLPLKEAKELFERDYLIDLLRRHDGRVQSAALEAEVHPKSLARLLRRHRIDRV
jgi:DNA-binding NtrC family response regulator